MFLLLQAKGESVICTWRDQKRCRDRRAEQGREVDLLLKRGDLGKVLLKGDRQQEGEENLDAGQGYPQLLKQLSEVAIQPRFLTLLPTRRALSHGATIGEA